MTTLTISCDYTEQYHVTTLTIYHVTISCDYPDNISCDYTKQYHVATLTTSCDYTEQYHVTTLSCSIMQVPLSRQPDWTRLFMLMSTAALSGRVAGLQMTSTLLPGLVTSRYICGR